uniref:Uncharacterized protein n=1 Tax=Heterorhabditis bacteriophora TaxID=37862 RepID=A0A1I7XUJ6_HETBA
MKIYPFLDYIVSSDEKWIPYGNCRRPTRWLDRDEAPQHLPNTKLHQKKVTGVAKVHQELRRLRPKLVNRKGPILLHDNDRPQKLNELRYGTPRSPAHSPDLSDRLPLFQASRQLLQEVFNNQVVAKNVFEEFIVSKILCCRSK